MTAWGRAGTAPRCLPALRGAANEPIMPNIGPGELIVVALIALLLFGAGRIADIGKGLGQGIRNFKEGLKEGEQDSEDDKVASKPAKASESRKKRVVVEDDADSEADDKSKEKA